MNNEGQDKATRYDRVLRMMLRACFGQPETIEAEPGLFVHTWSPEQAQTPLPFTVWDDQRGGAPLMAIDAVTGEEKPLYDHLMEALAEAEVSDGQARLAHEYLECQQAWEDYVDSRERA